MLSIDHGGKRLDDKRREKLLKIQKREKLKDLLVKKFIQKYPRVSGPEIAARVGAAVSQDTISEASLAELEAAIRKLAGVKDVSATSVAAPGLVGSGAASSSESNPTLSGSLSAPALSTKKRAEDLDVMVYDQFG